MNTLTKSECNSFTRRKLNATKYWHKTYFEEGRASDVKIIALNREWNLHKILLEKSPYFHCMFSGPWIETTQREINIGIEDATITPEALHKVFESLYTDEIQIEPSEVIPILACATLFQLDDLTYHCAEVMKASLDIDTAIPYYEATDRYSIEEVKNITLDWLYRFSMCAYYTRPRKIRLISIDLMRELVTSPELCVPNEITMFIMLILWVFLKENSTSENCDSLFTNEGGNLYPTAINYFKNLENEKAFLETESGIVYQPVFRALRLQNLILYMDVEKIEEFKIIPKDWLIPVLKMQRYPMLRTHKGSDRGPISKKVSDEEFNRKCIRKNFLVFTKGEAWKRCFGFKFGLSFTYENGDLYISHNDAKTETSSANSVDSASANSTKHNLMYRITLYHFKSGTNFKVHSKAEIGLKTVSLSPNEKVKVLTITPPIEFPLHCKINFLLTTP